jgi:hypothetical protein
MLNIGYKFGYDALPKGNPAMHNMRPPDQQGGPGTPVGNLA